MKDLVLYCKSYRRDFLRLKYLLASIGRYNLDKLPFYISTPSGDYQALVQALGSSGYEWVADEDIVASNPRVTYEQYQSMPGGLAQQIIKSEFWRLKISENYLCLDSDCIFIKNFSKTDFLAEDGSPYTVLHQNKEFFQLATNRGHSRVKQDLWDEAKRVQNLFSRVGPTFYCAPAPFIWSAKVWESLDREYLALRNMSIWEFISPQHPETLIYGEALLRYRAIPLIAIEPIFRTYHYDWHYYLMRRLGETEQKLEQNYLGVIYQSTWNFGLDIESHQKSFFSRLLKRVKHAFRFIQSYI